MDNGLEFVEVIDPNQNTTPATTTTTTEPKPEENKPEGEEEDEEDDPFGIFIIKLVFNGTS